MMANIEERLDQMEMLIKKTIFQTDKGKSK